MTAEQPKKRKRQPRLNENQRYLIEHLWNNEQLSQTDIGRQLGYDPSVISSELDRGNVLDRHTLLRMNIHAHIKYSAQRGQYIATKKLFRMGQGLLLTPELKELIEHWINHYGHSYHDLYYRCDYLYKVTL